MMLEIDKIYYGNCLDVMKDIPDKSIDMILCDLPYGMTACKWDVRIPFEPLWEAYKRIIKDNGAIVLTASQPFTSELVCSNLKWFKCEWIRVKEPSNFMNIKYQPFKEHEQVLVFCKTTPKYNEIRQERAATSILRDRIAGRVKHRYSNIVKNQNIVLTNTDQCINEDRAPSTVQIWKRDGNRLFHSTQKPVAMFEYFIETYTNEGDLVLDNCIGSGTTAVACVNLKRHWIGIEKEQEYVDIANKRVAEAIYARDSQPELQLAGG